MKLHLYYNVGMMDKKNYIIFDLEWNQPYDGKSKEERPLLFEIIEIGAVRMNENREIIDQFHELVKPQVYHEISWRTQKMLHLKKGELQHGDIFPNVYRRFMEWCGENPIFCTWGSQDLTELQRNIKYYGLAPLAEKPLPYYNVQKLFAIQQKEENISRSLETAVDMVGIEKDVPFHRADSDAYYTARLFGMYNETFLKNNYTYDLYHIPRSEKEEIHLFQGKDNWYISRGYEEKAEISENRRVLAINCALCNQKPVRAKVRWFSTGTKIYYCGGICKEHGAIKGKLKIRKNEEGLFYADKLLTYTTEEEILQLKERKKSSKKSGKGEKK
ncbi:MAG: exonuclease domain-containing protein [Lachnospiraceae bacterium]|nr:exonuclease domain-containing protein [Lachnospiraceae bacterium]